MRSRRHRLKTRIRLTIPVRRHIVLLLVTFFLVFATIVVARYFVVHKVICSNQFGPCATSITEKLNKSNGVNILFFNRKLGIALGDEKLIKSYHSRFVFPDTFVVEVEERVAQVAFVKSSDQSKFYIVDSEGLILSVLDKSSLPIIYMKKDYNFVAGEALPPDLVFATEISIELLKLYGTGLSEIEDTHMSFELQEGRKVLFPLEGDKDLLFGSLTTILSRLNTESIDAKIMKDGDFRVKIIDLRFKNPVLR